MKHFPFFLAAALAAAGVESRAELFRPVSAGDISVASTWGGNLPGAADAMEFNLPGTYTASADMTVSTVTASVDGVVFDFSETPSRKITLSSPGVPFMFFGNGASAELVGGTWFFSGAGAINSTASGRHKNSHLRLSSGCVVTNVGTCRVGFGGDAGSAVTLSGESKLYAREIILNAYAYNTMSTLSVLSGSVVTFGSGQFTLDGGSAAVHGNVASNKVLVSGAGSLLTSTGSKAVNIGSASEGHCLEVRDGGAIRLPNGNRISVGMQSLGASFNRLAVGPDGTLETTGSIVLGDTNGSVGNIFDVDTGGVVIATNGTILVGGETSATTGNCMTVKNATLMFKQLTIGKAASSVSNRVCISGADTVFTNANFTSARVSFFGKGHHNEFVLDGVSWTVAKAVGFGYLENNQSPSNTIRLVNGAALTVSEAFFVGDYAIAHGNVLEISGGSTLDCTALYIDSHDNTAVISNGTLKCSQVTGGSLLVGIRTGDGSADMTGNAVVMRGSSPRISTSGRVTFKNSSSLRFEIPAGGYAEGVVPITAGGLLELNDTALSVDAEAFRANMTRRRTTLTLATSTGVTIDEASLAAANAALPEGCRFFIDDGKNLLLTLKSIPRFGSTVILR